MAAGRRSEPRRQVGLNLGADSVKRGPVRLSGRSGTGMGGGEARWETELHLSGQVLSGRRRSCDTWRIPALVGLRTHKKKGNRTGMRPEVLPPCKTVITLSITGFYGMYGLYVCYILYIWKYPYPKVN